MEGKLVGSTVKNNFSAFRGRQDRAISKVEYGSYLNMVGTRDLDGIESVRNSLTGFRANS